MDLHPIEMDVAEAERAFRAYRGEFMKSRNQIDAEIMRGYKALSEGKKLISATEAVIAAGMDDMGLPRLAINRADEDHVLLDADRVGLRFYNRTRAHPILIAAEGYTPRWNMRAVAPIIPPQYRPPFQLSNYHLLWEVQGWTPARRQPRADPALLKHIGGDLYAVLAIWDLTELESRILGLLRQ
jgi:hypothetical protein